MQFASLFAGRQNDSQGSYFSSFHYQCANTEKSNKGFLVKQNHDRMEQLIISQQPSPSRLERITYC